MFPFSARPIEGLMGIVDTDSGQVLDVIDNGSIDLPAMPAGYGASLPQPAPSTKPVAIVAPSWLLHARANRRAGVILNLVRFLAGTKQRDVSCQ